LPAHKRASTPVNHHISLRTLMVVPFVLQIFAAVGLVGYLSFKNGQKAVDDLATQMMDKASQQVKGHLDHHLALPIQLTQINLDTIATGELNLNDPLRSEHYFWRQAKVFPSITYVGYSLQDGSEVGAGRWIKGIDVLLYENLAAGKASDYQADAQGNRAKLLQSYDYDPVSEKWYQEAVAAGTLIWSSMDVAENLDIQITEVGQTLQPQGNIVKNEVQYYIAISVAAPFYDKNRQVLGVTGIDLTMTNISNFLSALNVSPSGQVFIMERNGQLIGSSSDYPIFYKSNEDLKRYGAIESPDPVIRAIGQTLQQRFQTFQSIQTAQKFEGMLNGQRQFVQVTPWRDELGLDWLVVVTVPESDFMGQINANTRITLVLCVLALGIATVLGFYTSQWITRPIQQLGVASQTIASGQLDHTVQSSRITELGVLAQSFNQMAQQIRQSFVALEAANADLEQRVEARTIELKDAKLSADAANHAKSEFLANMSHELRTPLNGILGYAQILQQSKILPDKEQKGIEIIHQCATHLLTLINDILDLSKIEARKLDLQPQDVHLPALLQGVVEICQIKAEQKHLLFRYQPDADLPLGVTVDEKRLRQILINLLGNAIKFTQQGGVSFKIQVLDRMEEEKEEPIATRSFGSYRLRFQVADTGVGMSAAQLEKIFLPFEQVGDHTKQTEGTGLGLSISQKIVTLMGSTLEVQSEPGKGSRFWFDVTVAEAKDWAIVHRAPRQGTVIGFKDSPRKILVIDDRWENRSVLVNFLEPLGFELAEASDGQAGLEQVKIFQPDLIITDLMMPVMDGFEFLHHLQQLPSFADIPVLVSSASVFASDQQRSLEAGGTAFLAKPVQVAELLDLLKTHLKLTWIYEQNTEADRASPSIFQPQSTDEIVPPHPTDLNHLHTLAMKGLINDLMTELDRLETGDLALIPFIKHLRQLAKRFQVKQIREFLKQYL
jgi:signal transduction histidine kinase/DNA-binding NarL/FixJ family response regulator